MSVQSDEQHAGLRVIQDGEDISHSLFSSCFSAGIVVVGIVVALGKRVPAASQESPVPEVNNSNINKRTISHFLVLGRGKSCC